MCNRQQHSIRPPMKLTFRERVVPDEWLGHFDMLRDNDRNRAYAAGVKLLATHDVIQSGSLWLDVGCGSGLLGCLAAKYLQIRVIAFECVPELARIARETIRCNGLQDFVTVWLAHTVDLDREFMERTFGTRASFITSELLDTTFLGEGLYEGMIHAKECLLDIPDSSRNTPLSTARYPHLIPHSGRVFIQAWSGDCIRGGATIFDPKSIGIPNVSSINNCTPSSASTIQLQPFIDAGAVPISDLVEVFTFDFLNLPELSRRVRRTLSLSASKPLDAIVMFWSCCCCCSICEGSTCNVSENIFSKSQFSSSAYQFHTVPPSQLPDGEKNTSKIVDHWRQAVFFQNRNSFSSQIFSSDEPQLLVECFHDANDIWLAVRADSNISPESTTNSISGKKRALSALSPLGAWAPPCTQPNKDGQLSLSSSASMDRPVCMCGLHATSSCFRFFYFNSIAFRENVAAICSNIIFHLPPYGLRSKQTHTFPSFLIFGDNLLLPTSCVSAVISHMSAVHLTDGIHFPCKLGFVFTNKISLDCAVKLLRENFGDEEEMWSRFVMFVCTSHEEGTASNSEINVALPSDSDDDDSSWAQHILLFMRGTEICGSYSEHFFQLCYDQWILHHFLIYCQLLQVLDAQVASNEKKKISAASGESVTSTPLSLDDHCSLRQECFDTYVLDIFCAFFSDEELWTQYCGEVGTVEGIDMSAINALMVSEADPTSRLVSRSVRLSQWRNDAALLTNTEVTVGTLTLHAVWGEEWKRRLSIPKPADTICARPIHGIAAYGVVRNVANGDSGTVIQVESTIDSNFPQGFVCFEEPVSVRDLHSDGVDICCEIDFEVGALKLSLCDSY